MDKRTSGRWLPSRRSAMVGGFSAVSWAALNGKTDSLSSQPQIARGFVLEDSPDSRSRSRSRASKGLEGVMVSNGHDVTVSARDGSWSLPVSSGECIFVVKPSGWEVASTAGRPGRFFYLHQPLGSPTSFASRFVGVPPSGQLPESIDFALRRADEPSRFEVLMVADTQPGNLQELGFVRDAILSRAASSGAAFAIHHGDVMGDDLALYERYVDLVAETGIAWHHCPGNHDMNCDAGERGLAFETWKRVFGPPYYAFQYGGTTFTVLNNVMPAENQRNPSAIGYRGMLGTRQLKFVANLLANVPRDQLVVLSMHIPLTSHEDPDSPADNTSDRDRLLELLADRPNSVSFSGHCHTNEHHYFGGGSLPEHHHHVLAAASGNWWSGPADSNGVPISHCPDGSPKGFHLLSIDENRWSVQRCSTSPLQEQTHYRILATSTRAHQERGAHTVGQGGRLGNSTRQIVVNVFDGGPRTRVWLEFPGVPETAVEMLRTNMSDPHVVSFIAQHAATCKPWAYAARSSHIWTALAPELLGQESNCARMRILDESGSEISCVVTLDQPP